MKLKIYPRQGYRKWWLAAMSLIMSGIFVMLDKLTGGEWNMAIVAILGIGGMTAVGVSIANGRKKDEPDT